MNGAGCKPILRTFVDAGFQRGIDPPGCYPLFSILKFRRKYTSSSVSRHAWVKPILVD